MHVKLATYNIHGGIGSDHQKNPRRIGRVLLEMNADIIALQEVEYTHTVDELDLISDNHPYNTVLGPTVSSRKSHYGNVLLSRFPVTAERKINLSYPGREKRGAIDADIDCRGTIIRIIATHLGLIPAERRHQVGILLNNIGDPRFSRELTVLTGDMNEWFLWGRPLIMIHQYFGHSPSIATYPARWPVLSLDRIWCRPAARITAVSKHKTPLSTVASDHLPLTGTITVD
jgi:endonuclease/exonuclease/phosphatase family metal-dependent hydrolase